MLKRSIAWLFTGLLGLVFTSSAWAFFHTWRINEIYSNADGTVQFIELVCLASNGCNNGEVFASGQTIRVTPTGGSAGAPFTFPGNLTAPLLNKTLLLATPGFAAIAGVAPDYTIPTGFIATGGGQINLGGFDIVTYPALPTSGTLSISRSGVQAANTPKNFAGVTGSVPAAGDTTPNAFSFPAKTGVTPLAVTDSDPITVTGIDTATPISISGGSGTYRINSGSFVSTTGTVNNGETVTLRQTASAINSTAVSTTLTIGGVSAAFQVTTATAVDGQAPTVPSGVSASSNSANAVKLTWNASTDNVGVTQYKISRDGGLTATFTGAPPVTSFTNFGLAASTQYSYTVQACDAAANCSVQSNAAVVTTQAGGSSTYSATLDTGFNLTGNSLGVTLDVAGIFGNQDVPVPGVTENVFSVWKWNALNGRWAFHSPLFTASANAVYAAGHNYEVLSFIDPGEGFWVNAGVPLMLPVQTGSSFTWNAFNFTNLISGFNLIATASSVTPSQFNSQVNVTPPVPGVVPTDNFVSLWMWDAAAGKWYFYSPILESSGGLPAVKAYADSHNYLHFQDFAKLLGIGIGFWVNRP